MHKKFFLSYLFVFIILLTSLSLSQSASEKVRGNLTKIVAPVWDYFLSYKHLISQKKDLDESGELSSENRLQQLQLENNLLNAELDNFRQLYHHLSRTKDKLDELSEIDTLEYRQFSETYQKSIQRMINNLKLQVETLPAQVIFRSFDQWNSTLWINVGEKDNLYREHPLVAKNSIVLIDQAVVGIIDQVSRHQSRVRLITDSRITPSVRALRGGEQENIILDSLEILEGNLTPKLMSGLTSEEKNQFFRQLSQIKHSLQPYKKTWHLAKGELQGSIYPVGYGPIMLKGIGFNYDFSDEEGEARDLRTGELKFSGFDPAIPILKVNDVLVTTGMDGIFPAGLKVATVAKIELLREGDYYYEIEAKPLAKNLEDLSLVFVIPPLRIEEDFK